MMAVPAMMSSVTFARPLNLLQPTVREESIMSSAELKSKEDWLALLDNVDTILFDCDGVLWTGTGQAIPGAQDVIKFLKSKGKAVYFVTNNSSKSREEYLQKFKKLDFDVNVEEIFCVSYVASYYLQHEVKYQGKVYLMGQEGFSSELEKAGMTVTGPGPDPIQGDAADWAKTPIDPEVKVVIVGYDRHLSFSKLIKGVSYAKNPDNIFIGTNMDHRLPIANPDVRIPGTGCVVTCVSYGAQREPLIVGKPSTTMFQVIKSKTKLDPSRTAIIGDILITDIEFGVRHGLRTVLVLTGGTSREEAEKAEQHRKPQYIAASVAGFLTCS